MNELLLMYVVRATATCKRYSSQLDFGVGVAVTYIMHFLDVAFMIKNDIARERVALL